MNNKNKTFFYSLMLACLGLVSVGAELNAQLVLERELIGAAIGVPTVIPDGGVQQLLIDDSFGETMIGYESGDIIITVGFQQTENDNENSPPNLDSGEEEGDVAEKISVNAYPNPTIERLTVDLGDYQDKFKELRLIDVNGRTIKSQRVDGQPIMTFTGLNKLTDASYFLQGISTDGRLHQLTKVIIATNSSN